MRLRPLCLLTALLMSVSPAALHAGPWTLSTVDPAYNAGWSTSLRLDASGLPRVAYWTPGAGVRFASFDVSVWHTETVPRNAPTLAGAPDAEAPLASLREAAAEEAFLIRTIATSLALDPAGEPWVAHTLLDQDNGNQGLLEVSHRSGGVWATENLMTANTTPSIDVDAAGTVHLCAGTPSGLVYGTRSASGWTFQTIDAGSTYGALPSLRVDALGRPHLAYLSYVPREIRYGRLVAGVWQFQSVDTTAGVNGPSLAVHGIDQPRVAYVRWVQSGDSRLRYAQPSGLGWSWEEFDGATVKAYEASLALGAGGRPLIAFESPDLRLWFATFDGNWAIEAVDPYATNPSIAVTPQGQPLIASKAEINVGLRLATGAALAHAAATVSSAAFQLLFCTPNPVSAGRPLGLVLKSPGGERVRFEAYDVSGRRLAVSPAYPLGVGVSRVRWDAALPPGLCFIRARTESGAEAATRVIVLD